MVAVPRFGAIEEEIPLHGQKWNVQRVKHWDGCQAPFDIRIKQSKIRTDWATAIMPIDCRSMPAQHVRRIRVQAQEEVIFNGKSTARRIRRTCCAGILRQSMGIMAVAQSVRILL